MIKVIDDDGKAVWISPFFVETVRDRYCTLKTGRNIFFHEPTERDHLIGALNAFLRDICPNDEIFVRHGD